MMQSITTDSLLVLYRAHLQVTDSMLYMMGTQAEQHSETHVALFVAIICISLAGLLAGFAGRRGAGGRAALCDDHAQVQPCKTCAEDKYGEESWAPRTIIRAMKRQRVVWNPGPDLLGMAEKALKRREAGEGP
jgi:hypothetical protein